MLDKLDKIMKEICRNCLLYPTSNNASDISDYFDDNLTYIGTGKDECFTTAQDFLQMRAQCSKNLNIRFNIINEWFKYRQISPDIFLIFGCLRIKEEDSGNKDLLIEMDTRFSALVEITGDTYKILHIHHSSPYLEQGNDNFYPKTISEKANYLITKYKQDAYMDPMTGHLNPNVFIKYVNDSIKSDPLGTLYLIDINNFKRINDRYGHKKGDSVIIDLANLLPSIFEQDAYISRLYGNGFAVFEHSNADKADINLKSNIISDKFTFLTKNFRLIHGLSCCVGTASVHNEKDSFDSLYKIANNNLFKAKKKKKNIFYTNEDI